MQSLQKSIRLFLLILPIVIFGQDATVSLGHVEVDGYTNDIVVPVTLDNPNLLLRISNFTLFAKS